MAVRAAVGVLLLFAITACGDAPKEDKAKEAVRDAVTREFQYYKGAKEKLGEAQQQEAERREQEKQLQ
jgi:hypothetical protein